MRKKSLPGKIAGALGLVLFLIVVIFPFYWLIITSLKSPADISMMPTEIWPSRFSIDFYENAFIGHNLLMYLKNSIIVALGAMVITIVVAFPAAYAFASRAAASSAAASLPQTSSPRRVLACASCTASSRLVQSWASK